MTRVKARRGRVSLCSVVEGNRPTLYYVRIQSLLYVFSGKFYVVIGLLWIHKLCSSVFNVLSLRVENLGIHRVSVIIMYVYIPGEARMIR